MLSHGSWHRVIVCSSLSVLGAPMVLAQQSSDEAPVELEAELVDVPIELPGHEEGPRTRKAEVEPTEGEPEPLPDWFGGKSWVEWSNATGNWGGMRDSLSALGFDFAGSYTGDWMAVLEGGADRDSSYRHLLDLNATFDFEKLLNIEGGTLFIDFYSTSGESASADAGDLQGLSNIETDGSRDQIAEVWYEQWLFGRVLRVKFGKVDANSEFAFIDAAGEFINSSAGFSPSILELPTFPDPATSVNVFLYPVERWYLGVGLYDGASHDGLPTGTRGPATFFSDDRSDSWFVIGETGFTFDEVGFLRGLRIAAGGWGHTGDFDRFDGGVEDGTTGLYLLGEAMIWKRIPDDSEDEQGLSLFAQYAHADEDVAEVVDHIAGGVSLLGTFDGRPDDAVGVYVTHANLSREGGFEDDETVIEAFYSISLTPFITFKPDLQYILGPSGDSEVDDAVIFTLRMGVEF